MFIMRVHIYPAPGKGTELRAALEEWVKKRQALGSVISLTVQLFNPEGPAFATTTKFRDLAELENQRRQNLADPAYHAAVSKMTSLTRAPAKSELYEVLVPFKN